MSVILDCDPGHDDVVAMLLAARHADLRAVTTVSGNAPLAATTRNALDALELFGERVPVHPGADRPLVAEPRHAPEIHGASGLAGTRLPPAVTEAQRQPAVERILEESRATPALWLVATGPLTNVALALRADPALATRLAGIAIMGGGIEFGNTTPSAEFNLWADPEAAHIVVSSGARLVICPLDVTHDVLVDRELVERVRSIDNGISTFMADLFAAFIAGYRDVFFEDDVAPVHDACAVLALTHPSLFELRELHVAVAIGTGVGAGTLHVDRRGVKGQAPPNATVAVGVDGPRALQVVEDTIRSS